jgi:hypothetical protein
MAPIIDASAPRVEVKRRDDRGTLPLIGAVPSRDPQFTPEQHDAALVILRLIDRAMTITDQRKNICTTIGLDRAQLRRQLDGDGHLSAKRLALLPLDGFWLTLADLIRTEVGALDRRELVLQGESLIDRGRQLLAQAAGR